MFEKLHNQLDQEGVPQCTVCSRRFQNIDALNGHLGINHKEKGKRVLQIQLPANIDIENSDQNGDGNTEEYQLVSIQYKKCVETLGNNHLLIIHIRKHARIEQEVLKCTNCEFETKGKYRYFDHIVDNHSTVHIFQKCQNKLLIKKELVAHMIREG